MHSDTDFRRPPRRRIGAQVLIRDEHGAVLLVEKTYGDRRWVIPGGGAHENEFPHIAAERALQEETGLSRRLGVLLVVDHVPADAESGINEGSNFVYDGGTVTADEARGIQLPAGKGELKSFAFVPVDEVDEKCADYHARRVHGALTALASGTAPRYLVHGRAIVAVAL